MVGTCAIRTVGLYPAVVTHATTHGTGFDSRPKVSGRVECAIVHAQSSNDEMGFEFFRGYQEVGSADQIGPENSDP